MFGIATKKEVNFLKTELEGTRRHLDKHADISNTAIRTLRERLEKVCQHKKVELKESGEGQMVINYEVLKHYECMACGKVFDEKPKGSKVSRMKEVLSDK